MPPPPRIRAIECKTAAEVEVFLAVSCGTHDVGMPYSNQRHYEHEDWAVDFAHAVLRGCARAALGGTR